MTKQFVLASRNQKKIREMRDILARYIDGIEILSLDDIGFYREIVEDGSTFEENSKIKAETVARLGYAAIADDSGLCVDALDGAPGVYSARYSGEDADDQKNNKKLLLALDGVPDEMRGARFVAVITCVFPDGRTVSARGEVQGRILTEEHGADGFGYDPLFYYEPYGKTFAEMSSAEKNEISHRGAALREFAVRLSEFLH